MQEILLCIELESSSQVVNALRVDLNKAVIEEDLDQIYHVSKKIQSYLTNHSAFLGHIVEVNEITKKAVNALRALERVAKEVAMESMGNLKSIPRVIACLSLRKRLLTYIEHQVKEGHFNHSDAMEESCEDSCSITASSSTSESFAERKCPLPYDETASEPSFKKTKMEE